MKGISSKAIRILGDSLRNHFYLRHLSLRGSLRSSRHLAILSKALEHNVSLNYLDLSDNECVFADKHLPVEFVDALRTNGNIHELVWDRNGISNQEIETLVPAVLHNVTTLSLRSNRIDDAAVRILVDWVLFVRSVRYAHRVTFFSLRNKLEHHTVYHHTNNLINTGTKSLHKLDLGSNAITDVGASKISQALSSCALQSLNLSGNSIKDDGATSLATALKQSSSVVLRTLHLERNPFTSSGCREIAKMARVNLSLKHLSFAHYVLDDSALQSLRVAFDFF